MAVYVRLILGSKNVIVKFTVFHYVMEDMKTFY